MVMMMTRDRFTIPVLPFHVAISTTRRRIRYDLATNAIWRENMVYTEELDLFIWFEAEYADCIRSAAYEQKRVPILVSEELPSPINYDEVIGEQNNDDFYQTVLEEPMPRENRSAFFEGECGIL